MTLTRDNLKENLLAEIISLVERSKNILVFTGAGVSTSSGIPDFRGEHGLYSSVQKRYNLPYPEAVFDINYFKKDPLPFFDLSKPLIDADIKPSLFHRYIAHLESLQKIKLVVTQNIDMLHQKAGSKKVVECHGSYQTATCISCQKQYLFDDIKESLAKGVAQYCQCGGVIKPDIVFFGEKLPELFYKILSDPPKIDLLIVAGTSLSVYPAVSLPISYLGKVSSIMINFDKTDYDSKFTYCINDDIDEVTKILWQR